jgi:hypothetical protein
MDFEETGFFHIENRTDDAGQTRSYMVDPLGNLYFHIAACVQDDNESYTVIESREEIYQWLPAKDDPLYGGAHRDNTFSFFAANWARKNGKPYDKSTFLAESVTRMKNLGFTGIGAWSNARDDHMPEYAWLPIPDIMIGNSDVFDVFHDDFEAQMDKNFASLAGNKDNPAILGYLMGNERHYTDLRVSVLAQTDESSGVKRKFVEMMKEKYGDAAAFNEVWETDFADWDEMRATSFSARSAEAVSDFYLFFDAYIDALYGLTAEYLKKYDPNHMLMGDRWLIDVWNTPRLFEALCAAAGRNLDAISFNYYAYDPNLEVLERCYELAGCTPFIITEFSFTDASTGYSSFGMSAENETEKGSLYRNYTEQMAASGCFVGVNWFTYMDQAPTGRYFQGLNGEAYANGFFNVADRPYREMLRQVMETNYGIYDLVLGEKGPYRHEF